MTTCLSILPTSFNRRASIPRPPSLNPPTACDPAQLRADGRVRGTLDKYGLKTRTIMDAILFWKTFSHLIYIKTFSTTIGYHLRLSSTSLGLGLRPTLVARRLLSAPCPRTCPSLLSRAVSTYLLSTNLSDLRCYWLSTKLSDFPATTSCHVHPLVHQSKETKIN